MPATSSRCPGGRSSCGWQRTSPVATSRRSHRQERSYFKGRMEKENWSYLQGRMEKENCRYSEGAVPRVAYPRVLRLLLHRRRLVHRLAQELGPHARVQLVVQHVHLGKEGKEHGARQGKATFRRPFFKRGPPCFFRLPLPPSFSLHAVLLPSLPSGLQQRAQPGRQLRQLLREQTGAPLGRRVVRVADEESGA